MKMKDFIEMLKPCAPDEELGSVIIGRDSNGEETIDVTYKSVEIKEVEENNSLKLEIENLKEVLRLKDELLKEKERLIKSLLKE